MPAGVPAGVGEGMGVCVCAGVCAGSSVQIKRPSPGRWGKHVALIFPTLQTAVKIPAQRF